MIAALAVVLAIAASVLAGACAFADGALLAVDPDAPPPNASIGALIRRRERGHRALAFARFACQLGAGAGWGVAAHYADGIAALPLAVLVCGGVVLVVLSETAARDAGERADVAGLVAMRRMVELIERALAAVVLLGEWIDTALARALPAQPVVAADDEASVRRFRHVVAAETGMGARGRAILTGVFALGDTTVAEIMTPRIYIVGIEHTASWDEVLARVRTSAHARVVVHGESLDDVRGVLYAKDLLACVAPNAPPPGGWTSLVRPAMFVPANKRLDAQLREFRTSHRHIAIVADEFGGTAGLITIEDILELIVGEIQDEYDSDEPDIAQAGDGRYSVTGRLTLDQLSETVGEDLRHDDVATVGGLAYELLGRVPRVGESAEYRAWRFVVERVRGRRVERVALERIGAAVGAEDGA